MRDRSQPERQQEHETEEQGGKPVHRPSPYQHIDRHGTGRRNRGSHFQRAWPKASKAQSTIINSGISVLLIWFWPSEPTNLGIFSMPQAR
jgi:hypothetical protein